MKISNQHSKLLFIFLIATCFLFSCNEKERHATVEFLDPTMSELQNSTWNPGDSLEFTVKAHISKGRMIPVDIGLGRFDGSGNYAPVDILLRQTLESKNLEETFKVSWKLPEDLGVTSENNNYLLIVSHDSSRQSLEDGGNFKVLIRIVEKE